MGEPQQEDLLSRLHEAHSAIARILIQVDRLVLKAHTLSAHKPTGGLDLCSFTILLEATAASLQEWIPRFEDATNRECMQDRICQDEGNSTSMQENKGIDKKENEGSKGESVICGQSQSSSENLLDVDAMLDDKKNVLSDSPLVPWFDKVHFFILTPITKPKKAFSPFNLSRTSFKEKESLQTTYPTRILHTHAGIVPVNLSPSLDTCADIMQSIPDPDKLSLIQSLDPCTNEEESKTESCLVSVANTPSCSVRRSNTEDLDTREIATPLPPQSLVKRYTNFFEACEDFSDSSPMPLITPVVLQKQNTLHGSTIKQGEQEEVMEITEYFTAFSPPRSLAPSLFSVNSSPQEKAEAMASRVGHDEGISDAVEQSTPLPPQSLMKRYSEFLHTEGDKDEMADSDVVLAQMLVTSPPKTCILMRPNNIESTVKSRKSIGTPLLPPKSSFVTPGLRSTKAPDCAFYEDMDLASLKKPGQPSRPPESIRMTPSSDMQFATIKKALNSIRRTPLEKALDSIRRTPLVELQVSTVRKPGAPLPGEQTLKRELWSRMEAEFASMANVCKSLFTDGQMEASMNKKVEKRGVENRPPKSKLAPKGMQRRRGSSMY